MDALSEEFKSLYDAWGEAINRHDYDWFERYFADDFHGTAQPWPGMSVNKQQMLELERANEVMDVEWLQVTAERYGAIALAKGVVEYREEKFKDGAAIEGMPSGAQLSSLVNGKRVLYIGAWRRNGDDWQIFDHHMVGLLES